MAGVPDPSDHLPQPPQHLVPVGIVLRNLRHQPSHPVEQPPVVPPSSPRSFGDLTDRRQKNLAEVRVDVAPVPIDVPSELALGVQGAGRIGEQGLGIGVPEGSVAHGSTKEHPACHGRKARSAWRFDGMPQPAWHGFHSPGRRTFRRARTRAKIPGPI